SAGNNCEDIILDDITATITPADKTALTDAITAAKAYYDTIKGNTDYSEAADKLDKAIKAAEEVAAKDKVTKSDVSNAAEAVNKAKTTAEAEVKDIDDKKAAQAVIDKIAALPAKDEVTKEDKTAIDEARAAYNALTEAQKAKVTPETLKKLTDAEDKLVILQVMSEVSARTGSEMTYTGNPIQLINVPTTKLPEGYKMVYAVTTENKAPTDESLYTTDIPAKTEVGTYYVWYKVKGDGDHTDTEPKSVQVTITEIEITSIRLKAVNGTTMVPGASQQIEAVLMPSSASTKSLSWKSSNDKVATVSGGLVTVKPENEIDWGTSSSIEVEIKAASAKTEASITILVKKVEKKVTGVSIDPLSVKEDLKPGDTFRLTALIEPYDATDQTVTWESSDTTVAEISATGMVTIKKFGTATIKATSSSDQKMQASITLNVKEVKVEDITINAAGGDDYLVKGRSTRLSVTVKPDNATEKGIKWTSSDEKIAVVSGNVVTGVGAGKVTITATSASDPSKTAALTFIVFDSKDALYVEFTEGSEFTYTGRLIEPDVNVYYRGKRLMRGTDYTVSYKNNISASDGTNDKKAAKAIVTGKTVAAKAEATFRILPVDIGDDELVSVQEINIAPGKTASPVLYFGGKKLRSKAGWETYYIGRNENGVDMYVSHYIVKNFHNPYAGTKFKTSRPITVYGRGNFTGERELWVNVKSKAEINKMSRIKVKSFTPKARLYNGNPQPLSSDEIVVTDASDSSKILEVNKDYYISYPSDITSVGKVKVGIIGMGDYKGSYSKSYKIEAAKEDSDAIESVSISFNDTGDTYKAADRKTYASFVYDPAGVYPAVNVTVKFKDGCEKTLIAGRDYKVTYKNNKKAGAANKNKPATATVAFKGNYKKIKSRTEEFFIEQADLSSAAISAQDKAVTRASGKYPLSVPAADYSGVKVSKREYTVSYNSAGNAIDKNSKYSLETGKSVSVNVTITAKADANYKGSSSCSYTVTRPDTAAVNLSKAKLMICKDGDSSYKKVTKLSFTGLPVVIGEDEFSGYKLYVYTGKSLKNPTAVLKEGTDYTVSYSNNVRAGKATVIINAKEGSTAYTGSKTFNFRIVKGTMRWVK
ncbi:MAG: Ig-like domain-containing protein, partial [Lachnospiraceae bacterium]|nr:Ig-like domain-containing protein [Lachnospiraceae bacterium]